MHLTILKTKNDKNLWFQDSYEIFRNHRISKSNVLNLFWSRLVRLSTRKADRNDFVSYSILPVLFFPTTEMPLEIEQIKIQP